MSRPRVALVHAVPAAVPPIGEAFGELWPEAEVEHLLDEGLVPALAREGSLTPRIVRRICDLALYAAGSGADAVLFTCSAFTPAMDVARRLVEVPVLKPDEAMVAAALETGRRVGVVATQPASLPAAETQLRAAAGAGPLAVRGVLATGALAALAGGDPEGHDRLVAEAAATLGGRVDVICLAQFSMARARAAVAARVTVPVLTGPRAAVRRLRALLAG